MAPRPRLTPGKLSPVRLDAETEEVGAACGEGALAIPLLRNDAGELSAAFAPHGCPETAALRAAAAAAVRGGRQPSDPGDTKGCGSTCEISNGKMINCWR